MVVLDVSESDARRAMLGTVAALAFCLCACGGCHIPAPGHAGLERDLLRHPADGHGCAPLCGSADSLPANKAEMHRRLAVEYRRAGTVESRFRSIMEIDAALRIDPDNPLYHLEKGLTRYAQRFTGDAARSFKKATALDPGCFGAWYHLGMIHREAYFKTMCHEQDRLAAVLSFRRANAIDGRHSDTLFSLGLLALLEGRIAEAMEFAATGERLHPGCERFPLLAGATTLRDGRFDEAQQAFARALSCMDENTRAEFGDISTLLPTRERDHYLSLAGPSRLELERKFWVLNDPTPSREINERLLEHYNRVFLARELLGLPRLGLAGTRTARGGALVRYGLPSTINCDLGPGTDGPFVLWQYASGGRRFTLFFQDEFLSGNYHIPISSKYSWLAAVTEGVLRGIPQIYNFPLPYMALPLAVQSAQTRGRDFATRLEVSVAVPDTVFGLSGDHHHLAVTVFDSELNRHRGAMIDVRSDTLAVLERSGALWRLLRIECDLVPPVLESTVAIEVWGGSPAARGVHREALVIQDFAGRFLALGSVRITLPKQDGGCGDILDPLPVFGAGSIVCAACDIYNLRRDPSQRARYNVTYSIRRRVAVAEKTSGLRGIFSAIRTGLLGAPGSAPVISNSFVRGTPDRDVYDRVAIDIASLEPGAYLLLVEVEDLVAGRRVSGERGFYVTD